MKRKSIQPQPKTILDPPSSTLHAAEPHVLPEDLDGQILISPTGVRVKCRLDGSRASRVRKEFDEPVFKLHFYEHTDSNGFKCPAIKGNIAYAIDELAAMGLRPIEQPQERNA